MNSKYWFVLTGVTAFALLLSGCGTLNGNQMQTTVYDMHRRMVKLDKELESSVSRLNESTATLIARTDQSDQQTRMLQGLLEENQAKLDSLSKELESMKTTLYRHWNLTTSGAPAGPPRDVSTGAVTIEGAPTVPGAAPGVAPATPVLTPLPGAPAPAAPAAPAAAPVAAVPAPAAPAAAPAAPPAAAPAASGTNEIVDSAPLPTETLSAAPAAAAPAPAVPAAAPAAESGASDPRLLYQQAQRSFANEDYATALQQFDQYLAQNPASDLSANAQFWKGKCLYSLDKYAESVQAFEGLRTNYSTSTKVPFAMHNQAVAHSRLGQTAEAERLMEAVIEQYPTSPAADQARADLRKLRGE